MKNELIDITTFFSLNNEEEFNEQAIAVFHFQYEHNPIYRRYCDEVSLAPNLVTNYSQIPCLPVDALKYNTIKIAWQKSFELYFETSGTSTSKPGSHFIPKSKDYEMAIDYSFQFAFGNIEDYTLLFLLPSYMERSNSSLAYMAEYLAKQVANSGFYLYNHCQLREKLKECKAKNEKTLLLGVSFALLDFMEEEGINFPELHIIETGGMKGRKEELSKGALHQKIKEGFGTRRVGSEYGMTEMLSQIYSKDEGIFCSPPWLRVLTKDPRSPLHRTQEGQSGKIAIIDLAGANSIPFIQTDDIGRLLGNQCFRVEGRSDFSSIRGCSQLVV